jgi:hypothetical protein
MADDGFWKRRRHANDCWRRWRAAAALADGTRRACRSNSPDGSVGDEVVEIPGDGNMADMEEAGRRPAGTSVWEEKQSSGVNRDNKQTITKGKGEKSKID